MEDARTVIQEIANQLGMAVDQAGQFVMTYLPSYAGLKSMQAAIIVIVMVIILLLLIGATIAFWNMPKIIKRKRQREADKETAKLLNQVEEQKKDIEFMERLASEDGLGDDGEIGEQTKQAIKTLCEGMDRVHQQMNEVNRGVDYVADDLEFDCYFAAIVCGVISAIFLIITLIVTGCQASEIMGWQTYPEAKLVEMALKAIG